MKDKNKKKQAKLSLYKKAIVYKRLVKPSERVGVVLQVTKKEPTTIKNFIDSSLITGRSLY